MDDPKPRKRDRKLLLLLGAQIALVVLLVAGLSLSNLLRRPQPASSLPPPAQPTAAASSAFAELAEASRRIAAQTAPVVVLVEVRRNHEGPADEDELARLFGTPTDWSAAPTQGSGVVVDPDGYILTNAHVVHGAEQISVRFPGGDAERGTLVGIDSASDLALLKVDRQNLAAVRWADSEELALGDFVWAIGSPYGLQGSVSFGVISGKDRRLPTLPDVALLQTDAAINPGSSGGPLVDREGRVVGISTAILGRDHQGVGFAVPASVARQVFVKMLTTGK